ncbi:XdhC/CoxI family protein [Clostridium bovifaecis]|uniref:XdhC/CoxI family protein n=1 Tax=Clostridium bovifaecis TaxID=2184719 RepID=A0A6I6ESW2_9CLOT|nr:XdhC/CoxI family protein [Clostridium bovifaecis]
MKELFSKIYKLLKNNEDAVLVSVISGSGSTPRGAGARMVVDKDGYSIGTIGGGAVEYKSTQLAMEILKEKKSYVQKFRLAPNDVADLGMICGGDVEVYFQYIKSNDENISLMEDIITAFDRNQNLWLATEITDDIEWNMEIIAENCIQYKVSDISSHLKRNSVLLEQNNKKYYIEPLVTAEKVYIFGGGHISQKLVPVLNSVNFKCTVIDDKPEFTDKNLFPLAENTILADFTGFRDRIKINSCDYVVILTRGHNNDYNVLTQALQTDACYIGLVGSRTKLGKTKERLLLDGFSEEDFKRVYAPIGIAIKAETPEEIAVSIAGELIMVRAEIKGDYK